MRTEVTADITFGAEGNATTSQLTGWSGAENGHTWSVGRQSVIRVPAPDAPFGYYLEVDWRPMLDPPRRSFQVVIISVDGVALHRVVAARGGLIAVFCPPLQSDLVELEITFDHPDFICPAEALGGNDTRQLALAFRRLRILTLLEAPSFPVVRSSDKVIRGSEIAALTQAAELAGSAPLHQIFGSFELLAGNCDMGLALRAFGYEGLSLLRFGGASPEVAQRGLETDFAGIGEVTSADSLGAPQYEWMINDAFGLRLHSGQSSRDVDKDTMLKRYKPYAQRLARKLLDDVEDGEKIFVVADHRSLAVIHSLDDIMPLFLSLYRRGGRRLLWVCPAGAEAPAPGSVAEILPGLAQGHLDLLAEPLTPGGSISLSGWVTVLVNAWRVFAYRKAPS